MKLNAQIRKELRAIVHAMDRPRLERYAWFLQVSFDEATTTTPKLRRALVDGFVERWEGGYIEEAPHTCIVDHDPRDAYSGPTPTYFRDKQGRIERTLDGTPLSYDGFCNDYSSSWKRKYADFTDVEFCTDSLLYGFPVPETLLTEIGFCKVGDKWQVQPQM